MSVKRYDLTDDGQVSLGIGEHPTGNYTLYTDYAALEQENERLTKRVKKLEDVCRAARAYYKPPIWAKAEDMPPIIHEINRILAEPPEGKVAP